LVRHGESEYNRADSESRSTQDPHLYDARLTSRGREQARKLGDKLRQVLGRFNAGARRAEDRPGRGSSLPDAGLGAAWRARHAVLGLCRLALIGPGWLADLGFSPPLGLGRGHVQLQRTRPASARRPPGAPPSPASCHAAGDSVLWVVSPLTRAIETLALGCPFPDRLGVAAAAAGAAPQQPLNVAVLRWELLLLPPGTRGRDWCAGWLVASRQGSSSSCRLITQQQLAGGLACHSAQRPL
jgi:hypothetical protein